MECEDIRQKFKKLRVGRKVSDGREAYTKLFKFSDFKASVFFYDIHCYESRTNKSSSRMGKCL